ncbi:MCE family protein [Mycolicibacillus parakoreensis]|uniref:MCE family protein n=1 Tax=Mycolicibacillus parakoreensis TaxID=1069221 RepID=A0ABY3U3Y0_9MYCO|nr:MlaD family protein [Mycolicibacillus parakoreensis]MCV7316455.1 MCE family protein [Mycolicibacillus parakoreensis]ULN52690.1 MCE family protein [Mycolicibacillus parakoreensis]
MRFRGPMIGLTLFMIVSMALTWLVYATLKREVAGPTDGYAAMFSDVYGLREGDDVRMAGVRVGRVEKIELVGKEAKVSFIVQKEQQLYGNTVAAVTYQNIIGQRYVGLSLGKTGDPGELPPGSVIPIEQTDPSFDVGYLLNGFEPLMSLLDPKKADDLTKGVIQSLQGDRASITEFVDQTSVITESVAGRDEALGNLITSLSKVTENIADQNDNLDHTLTQAQTIIGAFDSRRPELQASVGSIARVTSRLSAIMDDVYPSLQEILDRQPGFSKHMVGIEPQLAFTGANLPLLLKGLARIFSEGAYINGYACDLNATGFFPGLNDMTQYIVNAATPGNATPLTRENLGWHTPRCRNMANG